MKREINDEILEKVTRSGLICKTADGFYIIDTVPDVPLLKQAKDNGELNAHIVSIESGLGEVLWERTDSILEADLLENK